MLTVLKASSIQSWLFAIDKKTCDSQALESLSHEATPASANVSTTPSAASDVDTTPSASTVELSDYEKKWACNIARNKQLLHELELGKGALDLIIQSSKKGKGKKTK